MIDFDLTSWLSCPRPRSNPRVRLYCFPHAGGGASAYTLWPSLLPDEIEVWMVQYPGRESRFDETPLASAPQIVGILAELFAKTDLNRPFAFYGHSLGGLIAFETLRALRSRQLAEPVHFLASAIRSPDLPDPYPPVHHLPQEEFVEALRQRYGGFPREVLENEELMWLLMKPLRADCEMFSSYEYQAETPLNCPITVMGGREDYLKEEHLRPWSGQTSGRFRLEMFPGGHFFNQTCRDGVLRTITESLSGEQPALKTVEKNIQRG